MVLGLDLLLVYPESFLDLGLVFGSHGLLTQGSVIPDFRPKELGVVPNRGFDSLVLYGELVPALALRGVGQDFITHLLCLRIDDAYCSELVIEPLG